MKFFPKTTQQTALTLIAAMAVVSAPTMAADLSSVNTLFSNIQTVLKGVAAAVVTIAFMVAGYKIVFGGSTMREVSPIVVGGLIIGAAAYLASLIVS